LKCCLFTGVFFTEKQLARIQAVRQERDVIVASSEIKLFIELFYRRRMLVDSQLQKQTVDATRSMKLNEECHVLPWKKQNKWNLMPALLFGRSNFDFHFV